MIRKLCAAAFLTLGRPMSRSAALTSAVLLTTAPQALAGWSYLTGDALYAQCSSGEEWDRQACISYIMGVSDGIDLVQGGYPNHATAPIVCSPSLSGKELRDIVVTYLTDPSNRHYAAAEAVTFALENAWPCKKGP
jgi:Rap1a immunity proteins